MVDSAALANEAPDNQPETPETEPAAAATAPASEPNAPAPAAVSTDLTVLQTYSPAVLFGPGMIDRVLAAIEAEARQAKPDASTPRGRVEIRAMATKVTRSKTFLDDTGKALTEEWRKRTGAVNVERRIIRDRLDNLAAEVRQPLTEFENAEKARVEGHEAAIRELEALAEFSPLDPPPDAAELEARLAQAKPVGERLWQEFANRAATARANAVDRLNGMLARARKAEADAADLARLRAQDEERQAEAAERAREAAERERQAAEARIADEAAQRARRAAEAHSAAQRQAAEEAAAAEREAAAGRERALAVLKAAAEERTQKALAEQEAARIASHQSWIRVIEAQHQFGNDQPSAAMIRTRIAAVTAQLPHDFEEFAEQAQHARAATLTRLNAMLEAADNEEQLAEGKRQAAAEEARQAAEQRAVTEERARAAQAHREATAAAEKRAKDMRHRGAINREARDNFVAHAGLSEAAATSAVEAIAKGQVPHVAISY